MGSIVEEKPTIVFVNGAWHKSDCWDAVTSRLSEHRYPFHITDLLSSGGDLSTTVADDAAHIQKSISKLVASGKELIVVMHSYGGIPGTESAKGLLKKDRQAEGKLGGIISLVYVTAFLLPPMASLSSFLGPMPPWVVFDVSTYHRERNVPLKSCQKITSLNRLKGDKILVDKPENIFYNDLPESQAKKFASKLTHQDKPSFYTPLTYPAYNEVPVSYLLCEQDNAIPLVAQQAMVNIGGQGVTTHVCSASHSPMLSMPEKVVDVIRTAAGEDISQV